MSLTLPRANNDPGRAARAGLVEPGTAGANIAGLGDVLAKVGTSIENDFLDRQFKRAQVDLTRDVNDLRLSIESIGDPDVADQTWQQGVEALRQNYAGEGEDGNARIHQKNADRFGLAFDDLVNRNAFSLGKRSLGLRDAQREATYQQYTHEATRAAANSDTDTRAVLIGQGDEHIDGLLAAGVIDAAEAERRKFGLRGDISNARAIGMVTDDPEALLAEIASGGLDGLSASTLSQYEKQAKSAIASRDKTTIKEADRAAKARAKEVNGRLVEMRSIMDDGREPVDLAFLDSAEAKASPEFAETMGALSLRQENIRLAEMTPAQIDALIAGEKTKKVAHKWQTQRLKVLEDWRDRNSEGYAKDPIAYAQSVGHPVTPLPEFDAANPNDFSRALSARIQDATDLVEGGFFSNPRFLTNDERESLKAAAALNNDPAERAALALTLTRALPPGAPTEIISGVIGDPVFSHVGGLIAAGGNQPLGVEVLRGQQVIDQGNVVMPPVADRLNSAFNDFAGYFASIPNGEQVQSSIVAAADALYAARVRQSDPTADIDTTIYRQALHEVMGGTGLFDKTSGFNRTALGGIQPVRGVLTALPPGIGPEDIDQVFTGLRLDLDGQSSAEFPAAVLDNNRRVRANVPIRPVTKISGAEAQARANARLQAASISGGLPGINGQPIEADTLANLSIRAVGPDSYQMVDAQGRWVEDLQTGEAWEFDLKKLVRAYPK